MLNNLFSLRRRTAPAQPVNSLLYPHSAEGVPLAAERDHPRRSTVGKSLTRRACVGMRGGASATNGSTNPGERESDGARRNGKALGCARDQRRDRIGSGGIGSAHTGSSVSAFGHPAGGGCGWCGREIARRNGGRRASREGREAAARKDGAPQGYANTYFPAGDVGDIERRPHSFLGSAAMAYVTSCHRRRAHCATGGTRGEGARNTRDTRKGN